MNERRAMFSLVRLTSIVGTIADTETMHPQEFYFDLNSHTGIQGKRATWQREVSEISSTLGRSDLECVSSSEKGRVGNSNRNGMLISSGS